eukprot:CAMPEP_0196584336 /NCGR_PEP_ID=MMETSP1081-20130531/46695_1 /TAXON_ID=36882 /ORGANISM="Pyramimonas amylifera, Strain CCMP720" /LENGTH=238 /DNA_ID=CAMNT_0041905507 /DNA_START=190 /DNA_END=906 /DNA_ORIENTATION=+
MTFGCLMDDHGVGGEQLEGGKKDPRFPQWKATTDRLLVEIGDIYEYELLSKGLGPPKDPHEYLASPELEDPRYFDTYRYAQYKVALKYLDCDVRRNDYFARIGRKTYELLRNQISKFGANSDPEDLRNMREWMSETLNSLKAFGLVKDIGTTWPKKTYDKWDEDSSASFELWMREPIMFNSTLRVFQENKVKGADLISRVIQQHFNGYLVELKEKKFDPTKFIDEKLVKIKFTLEGLL